MSKPEKKNKKVESEKKNKPSKENKKKEVKKTKTPKTKKTVSKNKGVKKVKRIRTEGLTTNEAIQVVPKVTNMRTGEFEVKENKIEQEYISSTIQKAKTLESLKNDPIIQKVEIYNELKNEKHENNELTNQLVRECNSDKKPNWFKRILNRLRDIYL